jgi:P-type E1-E2 ATPase
VLLWRPRQLLGALRFAEVPRPEAATALEELRRAGARIGLVSGDTQAAAVVPALFTAGEAALGLLPEDKVAYIRRARLPQAGGAVAMVGDGVNDAPALAAADLGIAVGSATDLARMTADVAIVGDDLRRVPWLVVYARRVRTVIRQNLFWAFAYNAGAVFAAAAGVLNPLIASLAMLGSSIVVVANARRLRVG